MPKPGSKPNNPIKRKMLHLEYANRGQGDHTPVSKAKEQAASFGHQEIPNSGGLCAAISSPVTHINIPEIKSASQCKKVIAGLDLIYEATPPSSGWAVDITEMESIPPSILGKLCSYQKRLIKDAACRIELITTDIEQFSQPTQKRIKKDFKLLRELGK